MRSFFLLRDLCGNAQARSRISDAQHSARLVAIQDQICLLEQPTDVGARIMAGHRMVSVAKQDFTVLRRYTNGA